MRARIIEKSEKGNWSEFIKNNPLATIHQTPEWGHFQAKIPGRGKYWIVVLEESKSHSRERTVNLQTRSQDQASSTQIIGGTMLIRHELPKGYCWLYAARGPLLNYEAENFQIQMATLLQAISTIAKEEHAVFLRIDPPLEQSGGHPGHNELNLPGFEKNRKGFQPEHTLIIDLNQSEEEILAQMKQKCRYNIRLAEKKGVKISKTNTPNTEEFNAGVTNFYNLLKQTTERDRFHAHDEEFYKNMLTELHPSAALYLAEYEGQTIAGIIVTYFKDTAIYYYGASGNQHRNLMAPYLLHWQVIKDAKAAGYLHYDLFGIAPPDAKNHPWQSVTEFKHKFGGKHLEYAQAQEYPFKKILYKFYRLYKR